MGSKQDESLHPQQSSSPSPSPSSPATSSFPSSFNTDDSDHSNHAAAAIGAGDNYGNGNDGNNGVKGSDHDEDMLLTNENNLTSNKRELEDDKDSSKMMMQPRPSSPVAKTLNEQQQQTESETFALEDSNKISPANNSKNNGKPTSKIPNLLTSGKFPPPPHSPKHHPATTTRMSSMSPPTILSSPVLGSSVIHQQQGIPLLASPILPCAPPPPSLTPYNTPYNSGGGDNIKQVANSLSARAAANNNIGLHPPLLSHRPLSTTSSPPLEALSSPQHAPPPPISPGAIVGAADASHYTALLNRALHETAQREQSRIANLTQHETQTYTTIDEYKHALARERRHSASLAAELTHYKFLTRYASCNVHSAAEINEEARINALIKNIDGMKKELGREKCRVVMELEREEERMVNGLVMRLEEVTREKMLLEERIGAARGSGGVGRSSIGGIGTSRDMGMMGMDNLLHDRFEQIMMADPSPATAAAVGTAGMQSQQQQQNLLEQRQHGFNSRPQNLVEQSALTNAAATAAAAVADTTNADNTDNIRMDEDDVEEEDEHEDENDEDILEGEYHDPEMEEELANLLKMKEAKKS